MKKVLLLLAMSTLMISAEPAKLSSAHSSTIKTVLRKSVAAAECVLGGALLYYQTRLLPGKAGTWNQLRKGDSNWLKIYAVSTGIGMGLLLHGIKGLRKQSEKNDNKK